MKRLIAIALLVNFIPVTIQAYPATIARFHSEWQDPQNPTPTPAPTPDLELQEAEREAKLAEERKKREVAEKEAAEARRAKLKAETEAFGDPSKVTVPGGNVTTDQAGFVEVQMLSHEAAREIVKHLSNTLCTSEIKKLVIYNDPELAALVLYRSMVKQLEGFKQDFEGKERAFRRLDEETDPQNLLASAPLFMPPPPGFISATTTPSLTGLEAIAIPGIATGIIKSLAELANLFRTDTEFKNKDVSIPEDMVVSYLIDNFKNPVNPCAEPPEVYYPKLFPSNLFDTADSKLLTLLTDISDRRATAAQNVGAIAKRIQQINNLVVLIDQRDAKKKGLNQKIEEKAKVLATDRRCRSEQCKKLSEEIALVEKAIKEANEEIAKQTVDNLADLIDQRDAKKKELNEKQEEKAKVLATDRRCRSEQCKKLSEEIALVEKSVKEANDEITEQTNAGEQAFLLAYKEWLPSLNKLKLVTQALIDSADEITSKLNTPDDTTKLTAMAQLLRAEGLADLFKEKHTFMLRVAVAANGTTKIKKNIFTDAKVRHSAGATIVYQLFDNKGMLKAASAGQHYFDYQSATGVRTQVTKRNGQENQKPAPARVIASTKVP